MRSALHAAPGDSLTLFDTLVSRRALTAGATGGGAQDNHTATAGLAQSSTGLRIAAVLFVTVLTALASQISVPLPFTPVPFTFQPMVVLLGGAALGARLGMS